MRSKEIARIEAIKATVNDVEDIKIFDDDLFSDKPVDSNHRIRRNLSITRSITCAVS
jgi:hypothetical protein